MDTQHSLLARALAGTHNKRPSKITYRRTCQKCQGAGEIPWNDGTLPRGHCTPVKCQRCKGTGKVTITYKR